MSQPIFDQRQGGFRIFVGNLSSKTNENDLKRECEQYGRLVDCWIARNPPGFAFVLYEHGNDAESAVRNMNGREIGGQRIRVEHAKARLVSSRNAPTNDGYRGGESDRRRRRRRSSERRSRSRSGSRKRSKKKSYRHRHRSRESIPKRRHKHRSSDSDDSSSDCDKNYAKHRRTKSTDDDDSRDSDGQTKTTASAGKQSEHSKNESSDQN